MVGQVKIVGILMLVHGITVVLMGAFYAAMGPMMMAFAPPPPAGGGGPPAELFLIIYGILGGMTAIIGIINVIAGFRIMRMRGRVFGIVSLFLNVFPLLTCYCAPTAIAMTVYGLIVLFQTDVGRAFEMVSRGATPEEAVGKFTRRYNDSRYDYDDMPDSRRGWEEDRRRRRSDDDDLRLDLDEPEPR